MTPDDAWRSQMWEAIGRGLAAHAVMLRDSVIVDDSIAASLLTAIDGARRGVPSDVLGSLALVAAFDDRVDSLVAAGAAGAVRIARARHDLAHQQRRSHRLFHPFDRPDVALRVVIAVGIQLLLRPAECIQTFERAGPFWPEP